MEQGDPNVHQPVLDPTCQGKAGALEHLQHALVIRPHEDLETREPPALRAHREPPEHDGVDATLEPRIRDGDDHLGDVTGADPIATPDGDDVATSHADERVAISAIDRGEADDLLGAQPSKHRHELQLRALARQGVVELDQGIGVVGPDLAQGDASWQSSCRPLVVVHGVPLVGWEARLMALPSRTGPSVSIGGDA
jgi:hypothetical protein